MLVFLRQLWGQRGYGKACVCVLVVDHLAEEEKAGGITSLFPEGT